MSQQNHQIGQFPINDQYQLVLSQVKPTLSFNSGLNVINPINPGIVLGTPQILGQTSDKIGIGFRLTVPMNIYPTTDSHNRSEFVKNIPLTGEESLQSLISMEYPVIENMAIDGDRVTFDGSAFGYETNKLAGRFNTDAENYMWTSANVPVKVTCSIKSQNIDVEVDPSRIEFESIETGHLVLHIVDNDQSNNHHDEITVCEDDFDQLPASVISGNLKSLAQTDIQKYVQASIQSSVEYLEQ